MNMMYLGIFSVVVSVAASARSPERDMVSFSVTTNVGAGNNVYVVGNHPDLGNWNPLQAIKLRWTDGNVWTGRVAVQKGTSLEYKFIVRDGSASPYCSGANVTWESGANRTLNLPAATSAPFTGKTLYYYSSWASVSVIYTSGANTNFFSAAMTNLGVGRHGGEYLHAVSGLGEEGEWIQFVMTDGNGNYDKSPFNTGVGANGNDYLTRLDGALLQDGQLYNYWPAVSVSAPRKEVRSIGSSFPLITARDAVIILPRGYNDHPDKRYPVMYFQDGQNITNGVDVYGNGSWKADTTAERETAGGRMREVILVGVYNNAAQRRADYNPPGDTYVGQEPGRADQYLNFLVHNVRPTIDTHYRTLNDPRNTLIGGSSMGGICSLYAATDTNVFGAVMAMSPSVGRAPNYRDALPGKPKRPVRIYMDTGNSEGLVGDDPKVDYWDQPWTACDHLSFAGYTHNEDFLMRIGCGHGHNETAWRERLPNAFRFLLDARDEPNRIAQEETPPVLSWTSPGSEITTPTQQHFRYQLLTTTNEGRAWATDGESALETRPWGTRPFAPAAPPAAARWFRLSSTPQP